MVFDIVTERQRASIAVAIVFLILPTSAVALRLLARRVQRSSLTPSDYCIFGALVCDWAICSLAMVNVFNGGVGMHQDKVSLDAVKTFLSSLFAIELLWAAAEGLIKTSMCLLYMQIFELRWFRISSYVTIAICNAFALMVILSTTFICTPVRMSFDPTLKGHCGNRNTLWLTIGVFNILTDLLVVALPLPILWHLQIPRNKKIGLMVIFSFGLFVCVVSCIRLQYLLAVDFEGDMSYTVANAVIWSLLEPTLAVTIGCLPTIFPLLRSWFPSIGTTNRSAKTGSVRLGTVDTQSRRRPGHHEDGQAYITAKSDASGTHFGHHGGYIHKTSSEASTDIPDNSINVMTEWVVTTDEHHIVHPRPGV